MTSRIAAVILGLIAGIAVFLVLAFDWTEAVAFLRADRVGIQAALAGAVTRTAWAISGGTVAFAAVASSVALIAGIAEATKMRAGIDELRLDPALAGQWSAADWRAAFAPTAIADHAETMIAIVPAGENGPRRVVVDAPLLLGLNRLWLDRLTLAGTIGPLPALLLGIIATLALLADDLGDKWDAVAAAGTAGWFLIHLVRSLARAALAPLVDSAIAAATAAIRPLRSLHGLDPYRQTAPSPVAPARTEPDDMEVIAGALSRVIREPLNRLADVAEQLAGAAAPLSRDQEIESAMAEVRAGIERLLGNSRG